MLIDDFFPLSTMMDLPESTSPDIEICKEHECAETTVTVQQCTNTWLCNKKICEKYYVHDTHKKSTFLGDEFKPDFMVSTEKDFPYGEFYVSFVIDVKSGTNRPRTAENVGQAAVYCTRLLELSAPQRRHASCLVANLYEAVIVRVERGGERGKWIYRKVVLDAKTAIFTMFNADRVTLGCIRRTIPVKINNQEMMLKKYLGSGASGIVYETNQKYAVKFFYKNKGLKSKEKHIIDTLNLNKPTGSNVLLQQVIESDDVVFWPALLLKPVGTVFSPKSNFTSNLEDSFFSVLETLKYAHRQGIIHNDIRPENIVVAEGGEMAIYWLGCSVGIEIG